MEVVEGTLRYKSVLHFRLHLHSKSGIIFYISRTIKYNSDLQTSRILTNP
jgi:hypothetical protein